MAMLQKFIYKFNAILIKIKKSFPQNWKVYSKNHVEPQRHKNKQGNTEEQQNWRTTNRYQDLLTIVIKTVCSKNKLTKPKENPETNPYMLSLDL